ncbi:putative RNA-directed DNA polymerase from transposon X-element [Trichonephila clavipes]|nr:putative RNA-directed DNA polymerase from transposon X-element [Trichonephila clavipes]
MTGSTYPMLWEMFIQILSHVIIEIRRHHTIEDPKDLPWFGGHHVDNFVQAGKADISNSFQANFHHSLHSLEKNKEKGTLFFGNGRTKSLSHHYLEIWWSLYGSARASVLKRLDTVHHSALRICSGAFRTSPVTSLYVVCHQPPLELRRRQLSANYFIRAMSIPSHPLKPFALAIGLKRTRADLNRLYEARSFNIKPFSESAKTVLNDAHLNNRNIQENNIFLLFHPGTSKFLTITTPFRSMTEQALLLLFISNSFLSIAINILSTYRSTRTGRGLQNMLGVVLFLSIPFLVFPYAIPCLSLVLD